MEEATTDVVELAKERALGLEVEPEVLTRLLQL